MAIGDELTLRVVGRYQSQNIVNTLHYKITDQSVPETQACSSLCTAWNSSVKSDWLDAHIDQYTLVGLKAFRKTGDPKTPGFLAIGDAGNVVDTVIPSSVCRTITLYTDSANHRRRGRVMLSGSGQAMFDATDGSITSVHKAILDILGQTLIDPLTMVGNSWQLIIPSTAILPLEDVTDFLSRETPSSVTSRRIRQFLVG